MKQNYSKPSSKLRCRFCWYPFADGIC